MGTHYRGTPAEVQALNAFIKLMRATSSIQTRLERQLMTDRVTGNQFGVLEALWHLGPLTHGELGTKLLTAKGNITMLVDNLEKRHWVRRIQDAADRRRALVHLTPEGRRAIATILPRQVAAIVREVGVLSSTEQQELGRLCKKLGQGRRS